MYLDLTPKPKKEQTEQSKRITAHNKMIREGRVLGILKPLGSETYHTRMEKLLKEAPHNRERKYVTASGSVLPNKQALWNPPFDDYIEEDY